MTEPSDTCINCGQRLAYGVDPSCCSWSCDADLRRKLTRLTAAMAEAEAIFVALEKWQDIPCVKESHDGYMEVMKLLSARRKKGDAK